MLNFLSFFRSKLADGEVLIRRGTNVAGVDPSTLGGGGLVGDEFLDITDGAAGVALEDTTNNDVSGVLTLRHTTSGTSLIGIGTALFLEAEGAGGPVLTAAFAAALTTVTGGSEVGRALVLPAVSGNPVAGLRVNGVASATNGIDITTALSGSAPVIAVYSGDANAGVSFRPKGTGVLTLQGGNAVDKLQVSSAGLGFFGTAPQAQVSAIPDAVDDSAVRLQLNTLLAALRTYGLIPT